MSEQGIEASQSLSEDIRQQEPKVLEQVESILKKAREIGADEAEVAAFLSDGFSVTVRQGELDQIHFNRDQSFGITLYRGQAKGSASATDGSATSVEEAVTAAWHIASHTTEDNCNGLAAADQMASSIPDLDLYHPWHISPDDAKVMALASEAAAKAVDTRITNSSGTTVTTAQSCGAYGNTHGFSASASGARHSVSCAVIASDAGEMQQDYWYTLSRKADLLETAEDVGRVAGERTVARLGGKPIKTQVTPVVFASWIATSLISHLMDAISGGNLYRKNSFLIDSVGKQVLPKQYSIYEQPYRPGELGSSAFDGDGLATREQAFIADGVVDRYVLSTYSARRLGLQSTANAGGVHNLQVTDDGLTLDALLAELGDGIYITELMGQGVNLVTGDYSRGASGFLVENGKLTRPVQGVTLAGNLSTFFDNVRAIGSDTETRGNIQVGSILIGDLTVAGT